MYNREENPAALRGEDILEPSALADLKRAKRPAYIKTRREIELEKAAQLAADVIKICSKTILELHPGPAAEEMAVSLTDCRSRIIRALESH